LLVVLQSFCFGLLVVGSSSVFVSNRVFHLYDYCDRDTRGVGSRGSRAGGSNDDEGDQSNTDTEFWQELMEHL
jgi:hypothetical protein